MTKCAPLRIDWTFGIRLSVRHSSLDIRHCPGGSAIFSLKDGALWRCPMIYHFRPESFSGRVRVFPLPNLVVFPHVMQPLHIFEPRYRAMLEEALADDGLIGMALLASGWESDYEGRPPLRRVGCLCRVATHHRTSEGSYNVLVLGLRRIRSFASFRRTNHFARPSRTVRRCLSRRGSRCPRQAPASPARIVQTRLAKDSRGAGTTGSTFGRTNSAGDADRHCRLYAGYRAAIQRADAEETCVDRRAEELLEFLSRLRRLAFPPEFSVN